MAHYDIYQSLGLDRSAPTRELDRQLADRLAAVAKDDAAAVDELTTARAVVGNDTRKALYDQRLDDPNAEDIDVASLKDLAALDVGDDVPSSQQGVNPSKSPGSSPGRPGRRLPGPGGRFRIRSSSPKGWPSVSPRW